MCPDLERHYCSLVRCQQAVSVHAVRNHERDNEIVTVHSIRVLKNPEEGKCIYEKKKHIRGVWIKFYDEELHN